MTPQTAARPVAKKRSKKPSASAVEIPAGISFDGTTTEVRTMSPDEAAEILAKRNPRNRRLNARRVDALVDAIKNGRWTFNGDPIRFDDSGNLLDGQHRLAAIAAAGESITVVVVSGLPRSAQHSMDIGRKRTVADALTMAGEENAVALATALGYLNRWATEGHMTATSRANPLTPGEALEVLEQHPKIRDHVAAFGALALVRNICSPGGFSAFAYVITCIDRDDAREFIDGITTGAGLDAADSRFVARESLTRRYGRYAGLSPSGRLHLLMQAWLAFRRRESRTMYRLPANLFAASAWPDLPGDDIRARGNGK